MSSTQTDLSKSRWIPEGLLKFYAKFPLVVLPNEFEEEEEEEAGEGTKVDGPVLWIHPPPPPSPSPSTPSTSSLTWASSDPTSLRYQLLFLLRSSPSPSTSSSTTTNQSKQLQKIKRISFRPWSDPSSAPDGVLPALHLRTRVRSGSGSSAGSRTSTGRKGEKVDTINEASSTRATTTTTTPTTPNGQQVLLPLSEIRSWLDREWPLEEDVRALNGMPSHEAHTSALAYSHLVLGKIYPAYMSATTPTPTQIHLPFPFNSPGGPSPLTLSPTVYSILPTIIKDLAGGETKRRFDEKRARKEGLEGIRALGGLVREKAGKGPDGWMLGASSPSPLDALLASHLHVFANLSESDPLRIAYEEEDGLKAYVARVMAYASKRV